VMGLEDAAPPQINDVGSLDNYQPFIEIPSGSYTILHFTP